MAKLNDWNPETRSLLHSLTTAGFRLVCVDNGEEKIKAPAKHSGPEWDNFVAECSACEESRLWVAHPTKGKTLGLFLVYGNDPGELVADYHCDTELDAVIEGHAAIWEGRPQPMR